MPSQQIRYEQMHQQWGESCQDGNLYLQKFTLKSDYLSLFAGIKPDPGQTLFFHVWGGGLRCEVSPRQTGPKIA